MPGKSLRERAIDWLRIHKWGDFDPPPDAFEREVSEKMEELRADQAAKKAGKNKGGRPPKDGKAAKIKESKDEKPKKAAKDKGRKAKAEVQEVPKKEPEPETAAPAPGEERRGPGQPRKYENGTISVSYRMPVETAEEIRLLSQLRGMKATSYLVFLVEQDAEANRDRLEALRKLMIQ